MTYSPFYYSVADCSRTSKGKPVSRTWHRGFYHSERRLWYVLTFALSTYQRGGQSSPLLTFLSCEQVKEIQTYVGLKKLLRKVMLQNYIKPPPPKKLGRPSKADFRASYFSNLHVRSRLIALAMQLSLNGECLHLLPKLHVLNR